jgi:hypothetical protein
MHCPGNVSESINHMGSIKESTLSKIKYTIKESLKSLSEKPTNKDKGCGCGNKNK